MKIVIRIIKVFVTLIAVSAAAYVGWYFWHYYMESPWTRDARVRANIVTITPDVSGAIIELKVKDNQDVKKGDLLFVIDPVRYRLALNQTQALVEARKNEREQHAKEFERRKNLIESNAISRELFEQAENAKLLADANYDQAVALLDVAKLNLERTEVRAPVNGYVTNLHVDVGDYATAGKALLAIVNKESFYIAAYFEETKLRHITESDEVTIRLMGFSEPLKGHVESISRAIVDRENLMNSELIADVNPTFSWVRLAQRIPVRIAIDSVPEHVRLSAGMTATVVVKTEEK